MSDKDRKFLDLAMSRLKKGIDAEDHNVSQAKEDLLFLNGEQWDTEEKNRRKRRKRPMLTINMLPDKVDRVVGDMRQNRARVKVRPADINANPELARIREGMIMSIEYNSDATYIYDYVGARVAECGEGTWRVLTRYCPDNPFIQEIYLQVIKNSFRVVLDPTATDRCKSDGKWGFIYSKISRKEFEENWPGKTIPGDSMKFGQGLGKELWFDSDSVVVAEYFVVKPKEKNMCLMENGDVLEEKEVQDLIKEWEKKYSNQNTPGGLPPMVTPPAIQGIPGVLPLPPPSSPVPIGEGINPMTMLPSIPSRPVILKTKSTSVNEVYHYKITACDVLEGPTRIPGKYIPIIKVTGKERNIEGKDHVRGLVRDAKDPQKLVNYWNTSASEFIALAPKNPWLGTAKQFEGFENDFANANIDNYPFLKYQPDPNAPGPPKRVGPGEPPVALFTQIQISEKNLNSVIGLGPDLRDVAPDASAKSIVARQKPAELSTFPFIDNLAQAQKFCYIIINEMIPEVYDTQRDVSVRREDESETFVPINIEAGEALKLMEQNPERYKWFDLKKLRAAILRAGKESRFNDIKTGTYRIQMDIGPSYATQRQEAADKFTMLAQTYPPIWKVAGDIIVKCLDVQGAEELSARLRKTIPPGLVKPRPGEEPPTPLPPSPQVKLIAAKVDTERIKQEKERMKYQVEIIRQKTELIRQYNEAKEGDKEIRSQILKVLQELHGPTHPADQQMATMGNRLGGGEGYDIENTGG